MASDRLYRLAVEFRKTGLWKRMLEDQLFAVNLDGGRTGYVSVMGFLGEHRALAVYVGEEGLRSYHILRENGTDSPIGYNPVAQNHASIQVSFEAKDDLPPEHLEEARDFAKRNGIRFAGKNAFPMFIKAEPGYMMTTDLTEQDESDLAAALEAAIEVAKDETISYHNPGDFAGVIRTTKQIVLMAKEGDAYLQRRISLPQVPAYEPPEGDAWDELAAARVRKLPKRGTWQAGLMTTTVPTGWEHSDRPILPVILVAIDTTMGEAINIRPVALYESRTNVMLNMLMEALGERGSRPAKIEVEDEYTEALLRQWCGDQKIRLERKRDLEDLQEAQMGLQMHLQSTAGGAGPEERLQELAMLTESLLSLPMDMLTDLPPEIARMLEGVEQELGGLPIVPGWLLDQVEELNERIRQAQTNASAKAGAPGWAPIRGGKAAGRGAKSGAAGKSAGRGKKQPAKSRRPSRLCVLSVSLGTGCYRHIQVPESILLAELAEVILWAFDFVNDHAHAFFMDNHVWSRTDCYYSPGIDDYAPSTEEYRLQDTDLWKDKKFKFIFDFGDEWTFQCRVLRISDEPAKGETIANAEIIRRKGVPPAQYGGFWDDEDEWED